MAELIIDVAPDGGVTMEVSGVSGRKCLDLTQEIEEALGVVETRTEKPEMNKRESEQQRLYN